MRSRPVLFVALAPLALSFVSCSCDPLSEPPPEAPAQAGPCDDETLENTADAPAAVREAAGIVRYHYRAPLEGTALELSLLGEDGAALGTLVERQALEDGAARAGAMEVELGDARLTTAGMRLAGGAHRLLGTLASVSGGPRLFVEATFEDRRCRVSDAPAPMACAPGVGLGPDDDLILPGCGLDFDERLSRGELPTLVALRYRVLTEEAVAVPSVGGRVSHDDGDAYGFDAIYEGEVADEGERRAFLDETGVRSWLLGDDARRLLAVYSDASWARLVRQHVAHCLASDAFEEVDFVTPGSDEAALTNGSAGNRDSSAWSGSDGRTRASSQGDPHLSTFDRRAYDLQSRAEVVLARTTATAGTALEVQARFEPMPSPREDILCESVSVTTAVAIRAGANVVEVRPGLVVLVDGQPVTRETSGLVGEGAPRLSWSSNEVHLGWPDATELFVKGSGAALAVEMLPGDAVRGAIEGLFGDADGDPANDLKLGDGTPLPSPASFEALHGALRAAWAVEEDTSLFTYEDGTSHASFDHPGFPTVRADPSLIPASERGPLEDTCEERGAQAHALFDCVMDLYCTAEPRIADDNRGDGAPAVQERPSGVSLSGHVVEAGYRGDVDTDALADDNGCDAVPTGRVLLFAEETVTLEQDLPVDDDGPGALTGDGAVVPAGARVRSFALRLPPASDERPLSGAVRFSGRVVGVATTSASLLATDVMLPAGVAVVGSGRGLDAASSVVEISGDERAVRFDFLQGADAQSLRVLVEEVTP